MVLFCCCADADAQKHVKEVYATHVRRLMFILDQEQQARLRVEDKLDDMKVRIICITQYDSLIHSSSALAASQIQMARQNSVKTESATKKGFFNMFSSGGSSSSSNNHSTGGTTLSSISNLVADTISPIRRRDSISGGGPPTSEENAKRYGYNDREAALAETLEIANDRIMELVTEMESTQEAQAIVLETKESVLRSLARQNTHLAMEVICCV